MWKPFSCDRLRDLKHDEILKRYDIFPPRAGPFERKMSGFEKLEVSFEPVLV